MPWDFGATLTGVAYDAVTGIANLTGTHFGVNQYPVSSIEASDDGGATWGYVAAVTAWADGAADGTFAPVLPAGGTYTFRITTSDDTDIVYATAFYIPLITGPVPATGNVGDTIVIGGAGFGPVQGTGSVTIGGVVAVVVAWADGTITVIVPAAPAGAADIVVTTDSGASDTDAGGFLVLGGYRPRVSGFRQLMTGIRI
jgi:hypothetical protein